MKSKIASYTLTAASLYYMLAELITAIYFNPNLTTTYTLHTISELGIPNISPFYYLMNSGFIIIGLALLFTNFTQFKKHIIKNKTVFYMLTLTTSIGVIIVALIHGGNPLTSGYHTLGAVMAILGGNLLLCTISKSIKNFKNYQKITLILGLIGLIAFWVMFFNMNNYYMPVLERLSVYTLILWSFITGLSLNKQI